MRYLLLGGTFNPIHYGHLFLAEEVRTSLDYDIVLFIPTYLPVHKMIQPEIDHVHRLKMLKIAVKPYDRFKVETCEIDRKGASYSIDSVRLLSKKYAWKEKPGFIIGDDLLPNFHTWKEHRELSRITDLIVVHRKYRKRQNFDLPHIYIDNIMIPISSSLIRERVMKGKTVRFLLPDEVLEYMEKNGLYR